MEQAMQQKYTIKLKQVVKEQSLEVVFASSDYEDVDIVSFNVARPSLQLVGFYDYFEAERLRPMRRSSTASSATRRWPRLTSSSATSLLPMPESPVSSRPSP